MGSAASAMAIVTAVLKGLYIVMQIVAEIMGSPLGAEYKEWYKRETETRRLAAKNISIKEIF